VTKRPVPSDAKPSAGAVVVRAGEDASPQVLLVRRRSSGDWALPRATPQPGEPAPVAAVRAVLAQAGQAVRLGPPVGVATSAPHAPSIDASHWQAVAVGAPGRRTDNEVDAVEWVAIDNSHAALSGAADRAAVAAAVRLPRTVALVVSRHTAARARPDWPAPDPDRPLDEQGAHDAVRLAGLLGAWLPRRVFTSPSARCVETVTPYAARTAATVKLVTLLSEEGFAEDPHGLAMFLDGLVMQLRQTLGAGAGAGAGAGGGVVVCTHRPVLATVAAHLSVPLAPDATDEPLPPGGCWVAHVAVDGPPIVEQHLLPTEQRAGD